MKNGIELICLNIEKQNLKYFEVQSPRGAVVAAQLEDISVEAAIDEFKNVCEQLPIGRYNVVLSKKGDKDNARILRGPKGAGVFELPLVISSSQQQPVNYPLAERSENISLKEYREIMKENNDLKTELAILKAELSRTNSESQNSGINGLLNNPNIQNALAMLAANFLSNTNAPGK